MVLRGLVMEMMAGEGIGAEVDMTGESWEEMAGQVVKVMAAEVWIQMEEEGDLEVHMTEERCVILLFMNCLSDCYLTALFHPTGSHIGQELEEVEKGKYGVTLASLTGSH